MKWCFNKQLGTIEIVTTHNGKELFQIILDGLHSCRIGDFSLFPYSLPLCNNFPVSLFEILLLTGGTDRCLSLVSRAQPEDISSLDPD